MKRRFFLLAGAFCLLFAVSCEKKLEPGKPTVHEIAQRLYNTSNFIAFAKKFVPDLKKELDYFNVPGVKNNHAAFTNALAAAGDDEVKTESVFTAYNLSMNEAILRKNKVDDDLLQLFRQEKELLKYDETEIWTIIREGIDLGWRSGAQPWLEIRGMLTQSQLAIAANGEGARQANKLAVDEVWGCLREAVGLGGASVLSIAGLTKLAEQGVQEAVIVLSKWLAKRAGWIGAIVMVLDFSNCMYKEAMD